MINFKLTYNRSEFLNFLETNFLPEDFEREEESINFESNYTRNVTRLGECKSLGLDVFEVRHTSTHDARVGLSKEAFRLLYTRSTKNKALVLFVPVDNPKTYRFSLVAIEVELDEHKVRKSFSNPRRYSYLLGEGAKIYTPTKYLSIKGRVKDSKDLQDRFSVEVLTKEFYTELFSWYQWALSVEIGVTFPNDRSIESDDRKIEEHLIRLITRLMFVWFIKQKKLVPEEIFDVNKLQSLLKNFSVTDCKQDNFYRAILQNLFFATLNNKIEERAFAVDGGFYENRVQYGIKTLFRYADEFSVPKEQVIQIFSKVPFLNGGLFECLDKDTPDSNGKIIYNDGFSRRKDRQSRAFIPNILFFEPEKGILSILNKYNFTIEENSPLDVEVALDPELLGKVFENLLGTYNPETKETARKQSGSFYTPREIVQFMVDESLIAHLKRTVGDELEDEYRKLIHYTDQPVALTEQQKSEVFRSLKACKILDPACGSGAFPMGILNRMLVIIAKLSIPESISTYELKLYLIENCIYGIDIQSIAVQISKLRFFISLICEQLPNADSTDNFGIKPLPNLETKFVAANTLIGLTPKNAQRNLFEDPQIDVTRNELMQIRHKHFLASTSKQKKECRDEDKKLREKLAKLLDNNGNFAPEDAHQLANWNPYDQNASSPFFDTEWMFGIKYGFDVVIGNPPYVNVANIKPDSYRNLLQSKYYSARNKSDLYAFFIERGFEILTSNGIVAYIIPHTWKATDSFKNLREIIFTKHSILSITNLNMGIFDAIVKPLISIFCSTPQQEYSIPIFNSKFQFEYNIRSNEVTNNAMFAIDTTSTHKEREIYEKIEINSISLSSVIEFSRGIKTSDDYRFIKKMEISTDCKKIYRGKNIKAFSIQWNGEYIWYRPDLMKEKIGCVPYTKDFFETPEKIVIQRVNSSSQLLVAYDNQQRYFLDTVNVSKYNSWDKAVSLKYLCGTLNSNLINFWYCNKYKMPTIGIYEIHSIPIKISKNQQPFITFVDRILAAKQANPKADTTALEKEIDRLVYELYGLTEEEIKIVEGK